MGKINKDRNGGKCMNEFVKMRQKMGLTLSQIQRIYGVPYSTLQKWEHGIYKPSDYVLKMMWDLYEYRKKDFDTLL